MHCSWQLDMYCTYVDAFIINWSTETNVYVIPPFIFVGDMRGGNSRRRTRGIIVASRWPTQPWFPSMMEILVDTLVIVGTRKRLLKLPHEDIKQPLEDKL